MTEIIESNRLIDLVIEKHNRFLETFNTEFSELNSKLKEIKQQAEAIKKEIGTTESRIEVLTEKYHLLFYQAKKQREELFNTLIEKMRIAKAANLQDTARLGSRIEEFEKKLQTSKNIVDEEKIIAELKKLFYDLESAARKAGITIMYTGIIEKLNDANFSHKDLVSLQNKPKEQVTVAKEQDKQVEELEGRHDWLKHRLESHNNALAYWVKQKEGIKVD
jgi:SMC interacting uncharacterized protein involved in chromosome segregation